MQSSTPATGRAREWAPVVMFFALAFALTWALLPLTRISIAFSLLALFGPAAAALIASATQGRAAVKLLWKRCSHWRIDVRWYLVALGLPVVITLVRTVIERILGASGAIGLQPITPLSVTVFVLVAGEEVGWRGFAQPYLAERIGWLQGSVVIGVLWALWHLPLFYMSGMPQYGAPFPPYILYTIALSVLLGAIGTRTESSVIIATLFHGAVNTFGFVRVDATPELRGWGNAQSYGLAALVVVLLSARRGRHFPSVRRGAVGESAV